MVDQLLPQHLAMLEASGISREIAAKRGYRSITVKADLRRLGFSDSQCLIPTLLIPVWKASGEIGLYHHRPDEPRIRNGKPCKYEFPVGAKMVVDVHPAIREHIRRPDTPLFITEGAKKADSGISAGLCVVGVIGVWNWRGTNEWGGKSALPDWDEIALKAQDNTPRQVYIVYDSDVMLKEQVHQALARLSAFLQSRGASVAFIYLPNGADGSKVGLDDYLAAGHSTDDLLALAANTLQEPVSDRWEPDGPYRDTPHGLVWRKRNTDGEQDKLLTNFTARIVAEVVEDDGTEERHFYQVEAQRNGAVRTGSVPSSAFNSLNWVNEFLGVSAGVYPGQSIKDHAQWAIRTLSGEPPVQRVYGHSGWRKIGDRWAFLHAGGAIGVEESVSVRLHGALENFLLPEPPTGDALIQAIRASLRLIELARPEIIFPALSAIYRSVLGHVDFALHIAGATGVFKSEIAALLQQHFGPTLDARCLPASWSSTDNALEAIASAAKDAVLVIDDFAPTGASADVQRLHAKADRVIRAQGNHSGRGRLRADGSFRPTRPPRGLIVSTGEDIPLGQSLRARMAIIEIGRNDIAKEGLTQCQKDAAAGLYAASMAAFLAWLAPRYEEVQRNLRAEIERLRDEARSSDAHRRTPEIAANLGVGLRYLLAFAQFADAIEEPDAVELWQRGWQAIGKMARSQAKHQVASDPTIRFLELITAALSSGQAHVAGVDDSVPAHAERWGWRDERGEWHSQGARIGWVNRSDLYLQPDTAYNIAKKLGNDSGDPIAVSARTLHKRLHERNLLASTEPCRDQLTIRRMIAGARRSVLHLRAGDVVMTDDLMLEKPDQPDQTGHWDEIGSDLSEEEAGDGRIPWSGFSQDGSKPDHENRPEQSRFEHENSDSGRNGRVFPTNESRNGRQPGRERFVL